MPHVHLRLLATTDLHAQVFPHDYFADCPLPGRGLAHVARLIEAARAEVAQCLLFDNGDMLNGNPMGDVAARAGADAGAGVPHPVIAAMNVLGYDAAAVGNHDLDYGLPALLRAAGQAAFPLLCANLVSAPADDHAEAERPLPPHALLERRVTDTDGGTHMLRVGVIGLVPPRVTAWAAHVLGDALVAQDPVETAAAMAPRLRAAGADLVVALAHTGIAPGEGADPSEHAALALARVAGIDAVITGHSHQLLPGPHFAGIEGVDAAAGALAGKPAVMAGVWGSHLGLIDLTLARGAGGWQVVAHRAALRATDPGQPACPAVLAAARPGHEATLAQIRRPVGRSLQVLHSHFALAGDCAMLQLQAAAQRAHVAAQLAPALADLPVLAAVAPLKSGGRGGPGHFTEVPAGELLLRHVADIHPFPDMLCALRITGAQLVLWLERSAALFSQTVPGGPPVPLRRPEMAGHDFDVIDGVTYAVDLSRPPLRPGGTAAPGRILDLRHAGRPVLPGQEFVLALTSYRAAGGGGFPGVDAMPLLYRGRVRVSDIIARHIAACGTVGGAVRPGWRLAPVPGASAIIETGPGAARIGPPAGLAITPLGPGPGGFLRWHIDL